MTQFPHSFPALPATLSAWPLLTPGARESLAISGALASVVLVVFGGALLLRKGRHRHLHHGSAKTPQASRGNPPARRRRRHHRPRNPTLAETGGLPPVRHQEPDSPA